MDYQLVHSLLVLILVRCLVRQFPVTGAPVETGGLEFGARPFRGKPQFDFGVPSRLELKGVKGALIFF